MLLGVLRGEESSLVRSWVFANCLLSVAVVSSTEKHQPNSAAYLWEGCEFRHHLTFQTFVFPCNSSVHSASSLAVINSFLPVKLSDNPAAALRHYLASGAIITGSVCSDWLYRFKRMMMLLASALENHD